MFLCKSFFKTLAATLLTSGLLVSSHAFAQDMESMEPLQNTKTLALTTISLEYVSWEELMRVDSGTQLDNAYANFYGNAVSAEREIYHGSRSGMTYGGAFLFGQANAGGTQTTLTYQASNRKWFGAMADARFTYRMTPTITTSVGPMGLLRQVSWPDNGTGYLIKSGSDFNVGILGELGLRMTRAWEARMEMGTLFFRASTYWSVGLGYKY